MNKGVTGRILQGNKVVWITCIGKRVEVHHRVIGGLMEEMNTVRADETSGTGYEDSHGVFL